MSYKHSYQRFFFQKKKKILATFTNNKARELAKKLNTVGSYKLY